MKKTILLLIGFVAFNFNNQAQTISDIDGNTYNTVSIGTQVWIKENLKTTKYNNGTVIPLITDETTWGSLTTGAQCTYNNTTNADTINIHGRLYNWFTVNTGKLCPTGWHVPTDTEWSTLEIYLQNNGYNYDGSFDTDNDRKTNNKIAKSLASTSGWSTSSGEGAVGNTDYPAYRNKTGFSAIPGGHRLNGSFCCLSDESTWWSSTEYVTGLTAWYRIILNESSIGVGNGATHEVSGFSVRCLSDKAASAITDANVNEINIYPNPSKDKLYIQNIISSNSSIEIFNLQGEMLLNKRNNLNTTDISNLKNGVYIVKILDSGKIKMSKFIKE